MAIEERYRERWKKRKFYHYYIVLPFVNKIVQSFIITVYIQFINICQFYKIQNMSYTKKNLFFYKYIKVSNYNF